MVLDKVPEEQPGLHRLGPDTTEWFESSILWTSVPEPKVLLVIHLVAAEYCW